MRQADLVVNTTYQIISASVILTRIHTEVPIKFIMYPTYPLHSRGVGGKKYDKSDRNLISAPQISIRVTIKLNLINLIVHRNRRNQAPAALMIHVLPPPATGRIGRPNPRQKGHVAPTPVSLPAVHQ
jgi:hypothetical protein